MDKQKTTSTLTTENKPFCQRQGEEKNHQVTALHISLKLVITKGTSMPSMLRFIYVSIRPNVQKNVWISTLILSFPHKTVWKIWQITVFLSYLLSAAVSLPTLAYSFWTYYSPGWYERKDRQERKCKTIFWSAPAIFAPLPSHLSDYKHNVYGRINRWLYAPLSQKHYSSEKSSTSRAKRNTENKQTNGY